jgi:VanZ family protein
MKNLEASIMRVIPHDKCLHVIVGVLIFGAAHFMTWQLGLVAALLAGIAKETLDHFTGGDVSVWDAVATLAGGVLGLVCFAR